MILKSLIVLPKSKIIVIFTKLMCYNAQNISQPNLFTMKAPLSKQIARVLRNEDSASKLVSKVIESRNSNAHGRITVTIGNDRKVYRAAGSSANKK